MLRLFQAITPPNTRQIKFGEINLDKINQLLSKMIILNMDIECINANFENEG